MPETSVQPESPFETAEQPFAPAVNGRSHPGEMQAPVARSAYPSEHPQETSTTSEIVKYAISILILCLGAGSMYGLYLLKAPPEEQVSKELIPMVNTIEAMAYTDVLDKVISGTVVPYREIRVAAEISGNVIKKYDDFEAGNFVKKGTKLIEIDPTDYQLQLETSLAEVEQSQKMLEETEEEISGAKRNVEITETEFRIAKDEFDRNSRIRSALSSSELDQSKRNLLAVESGLISKKNMLDTLNARLRRMEASLALAKAQLNRTKLNRTKTTIVAPDDGVIVREMVQDGDYVRAGDQLVMFEDTSRSEVICNLTPTDLAWIRENAPSDSESPDGSASQESFSVYHIPKTKVSVFEIADPTVKWEGVLERFDGIGRDESTRTIPCRITIMEPVVNTAAGQRALVRGMYVKCRIEVDTSLDSAQRKFVAFPAVALRPGKFVWIVEDLKLRKVPVEIVDYTEQTIDGKETKIVVVVTSEGTVQAGDAIVKTPLAQPSEGIEVIVEE